MKAQKHSKKVLKIARGLISAQNADKENYIPYEARLDKKITPSKFENPSIQKQLSIFDA